MTASYPKQLYLTLRAQILEYAATGQAKKYGIPLAFAHAYEPHLKTFEKKRKTQMDWAYYEYQYHYEERADGVWILAHDKAVWDGTKHNTVHVPDTRVIDQLQPRVIDNVPTKGFKIAHSVSRMSTSNKLWRIEDPRGFELEISTACMETILLTGSVVKGIIQGSLVWGHGKSLIYV